MSRTRSTWLLVGALVLAPSLASAQLDVSVTDAGGRPLPSARVELWSATMARASRLTDDAGRVRFAADEIIGSSAVLVRRLGFVPVRHALATVAPVAAVTIALQPLAASLPSVTIAAVARSCPQPDEVAARELWLSASRLYASPFVEARRSMLERVTEVVEEREVGVGDREVIATGWRGYTRAGMIGARAALQAHYVRGLPSGHNLPDFGVWRYPALHAELAGHFADSIFAARHTVALTLDARGDTIIRFCARDRKRAGLDGTLRLDATGTFLDARWRYWNPDGSREESGGEVVFAPAEDGIRYPLVSASGLFWRRLPSGSYRQVWERYTEWVFLDSEWNP